MKILTRKSTLFTLALLTAIALILGAVLLAVARFNTAYAESGEKLTSQIKLAHDNCFGEDHENGATAIGADYFTGNGNTLYSGSYFLTENIDLSETVTIEGEVMLCLNGYTLNGNGSDTVIYVGAGAALLLYDCGKGGNGAITGGASTQSDMGGGVTIHGGSLIMNGGKITGNTAKYGGGVYMVNDGTFKMNGGKITANTTKNDGGGVYCSASVLTVNSGEISKNSAYSGGGVYFFNREGTFTMKGGTLSGNSADSGGGVHVSVGTFIMEGGAISGNSADYGSGVYFGGTKPFIMEGGAISGNSGSGGGVYVPLAIMQMSGDCVITGNTLEDGTRNNLKFGIGNVIRVGELKQGAKIGVSVYGGTGFFTLGGGEYKNNFFSDDDSMCIWSIDGRLWIKEHEISDTPVYDGEGQHPPTCTEKGAVRYYCKSGCGYLGKEEDAGALGHDFKTESDADGHWQQCSRCGEISAKSDHDWDEGEVTKQPTPTEDGEKTFTCNECGQTKKETLPATGGEDNGSGGEGSETPVDPDISGGEGDKTSGNSDREAFPWYVFIILGVILLAILFIIIAARRKDGDKYDD